MAQLLRAGCAVGCEHPAIAPTLILYLSTHSADWLRRAMLRIGRSNYQLIHLHKLTIGPPQVDDRAPGLLSSRAQALQCNDNILYPITGEACTGEWVLMGTFKGNGKEMKLLRLMVIWQRQSPEMLL